MKLRILHFAEASDSSGYFPILGTQYDRARFDVYFGTLLDFDPVLRTLLESNGVTCLDGRAKNRLVYPAAMARLARFMRRHQIQIVHTHLFDPSVTGLITAALAGVPVRILTRHYSDYHTRIHKTWHVRADQLCTALATRVIAVSRHTAEHMIALEGAPPHKIDVVWNGVRFEKLSPIREQPSVELRRELGLGESLVLLVPARLHPEKGHSHLFRALPRLRATVGRPFVVLLAGGGSSLDYERELDALGCRDLVRFLGFRKDIVDLMLASDLVVLPSVAEAFGYVLVETLYLGIPVVATTVGGIPEIVDDGVDGLLVPPADAVALGSAVERLLVDPAARQRMAAAGRDKVVKRFSADAMMRGYEQVYERAWRDASGAEH